MKTYAGIGSRSTPNDVLHVMRNFAKLAATKGLLLRTGGAVGADTSFLEGALRGHGKIELYLPWNSYSNLKVDVNQVIISTCPSSQALQHASIFHPAWSRCSQGAQKLHARNSEIILGKSLNNPVDFIICWHTGSGGTMQAIRIAQALKIRTLNLCIEGLSAEEILAWAQGL